MEDEELERLADAALEQYVLENIGGECPTCHGSGVIEGGNNPSGDWDTRYADCQTCNGECWI